MERVRVIVKSLPYELKLCIAIGRASLLRTEVQMYMSSAEETVRTECGGFGRPRDEHITDDHLNVAADLAACDQTSATPYPGRLTRRDAEDRDVGGSGRLCSARPALPLAPKPPRDAPVNKRPQPSSCIKRQVNLQIQLTTESSTRSEHRRRCAWMRSALDPESLAASREQDKSQSGKRSACQSPLCVRSTFAGSQHCTDRLAGDACQERHIERNDAVNPLPKTMPATSPGLDEMQVDCFEASILVECRGSGSMQDNDDELDEATSFAGGTMCSRASCGRKGYFGRYRRLSSTSTNSSDTAGVYGSSYRDSASMD
eukprot:TRINITY_DN26643_c0_g3_i1.p1 TRINITY_DN26643_c0_g3~~TRINITY_DN26643_c0_g3_i1.p1  ORF type:complete len:315 (-),score=45.74 TRINITY_DN26643_c0_g3_i1:26-970(-)